MRRQPDRRVFRITIHSDLEISDCLNVLPDTGTPLTPSRSGHKKSPEDSSLRGSISIESRAQPGGPVVSLHLVPAVVKPSVLRCSARWPGRLHRLWSCVLFMAVLLLRRTGGYPTMLRRQEEIPEYLQRHGGGPPILGWLAGSSLIVALGLDSVKCEGSNGRRPGSEGTWRYGEIACPSRCSN